MNSEALIKKYEPLIKQLTRPYPRFEDDLAQVVRINLWEAHTKGKNVDNFCYAKKLMLNVIAKELTRNLAVREIPYGLPSEGTLFDASYDDLFESVDISLWIEEILTEEEYLCIKLRILAEPKYTLMSVAEKLKCSHEQVRRITQNACRKIYNKLQE